MNMFISIWKFLVDKVGEGWAGAISGSSALGILILILKGVAYFYKNDEQFDRWVARIERFLIKIGFKRDKNFIKRDIQYIVNKYAKRTNKEAGQTVNNKIKLEFVKKKEDIESLLRKGIVIIRMRPTKQHNQNLIDAVSYYVEHGIVPYTRKYLPAVVNVALNNFLIKKILAENKKSDAVEYFFKTVLDPKLKSDTFLKKKYLMMEKIDLRGLFSRIFLRELRYLGQKLHPSLPNNFIIKEAENFLGYLNELATRERGENLSQLYFIGNNIKFGILYVATPEVFILYGHRPYTKRIRQKISMGAEKIYAFAGRKENIKALESILNKCNDLRYVKDVRKYRFAVQTRTQTTPQLFAIIEG